MKRKNIYAILFVVLFFGFTACSSDDGDSNPTANNEPSTYSISGKITDQDGEAVSGYTVTLSGTKSASTTTNTNGEYSFADLQVKKSYKVTVDNASYSIESITSNEVFNFEVVVAKSVKISGTITDLANNPVQGVPLTFSPYVFSDNQIEKTSDANGRYEFNVELTPYRSWLIETKSDEYRYAGYTTDSDVSGLDGRGVDEAAGSYRTTDVVVDFKQLDDLYTSWGADGDSVSADAKNDGTYKSILSFNETGKSFSWLLRNSNGQTYWIGLNTSFTVTKSQSGNIHTVVLGSYEGIYEITKSAGIWTLKLEVVKTADGDTPPTVAGGFGSSNSGTNGTDFVWTFTYNR